MEGHDDQGEAREAREDPENKPRREQRKDLAKAHGVDDMVLKRPAVACGQPPE